MNSNLLILLIISVIAIILILNYAYPAIVAPKSSTNCGVNGDCPGTQICQDGQCTPLTFPSGPTSPTCDCVFGDPVVSAVSPIDTTYLVRTQTGYDGLLYILWAASPGTIRKIARYNKDGTPDLTFGIDGAITITVPVGANPPGKFIVIDDGGFAFSNPSSIMWKVDSTGAIDPNFPIVTTGTLYTYQGLVAGRSGDGTFYYWRGEFPGNLAFEKYTTTGIDLSYGVSGTATHNLAPAYDFDVICVTVDGSLILPYSVESDNINDIERPAVTKLTPSGAIDLTFGVNGTFVAVDFPMYTGPQNRHCALGSDDSIYFAGYGWTDVTYDFEFVGVVKILANGTLDTSWGAGGYFTYALDGHVYVEVYNLVVEPCGGIIIPVEAYSSLTLGVVHILRLDENGIVRDGFPIVFGPDEYTRWYASNITGSGEVDDPLYYHLGLQEAGFITFPCQ